MLSAIYASPRRVNATKNWLSQSPQYYIEIEVLVSPQYFDVEISGWSAAIFSHHAESSHAQNINDKTKCRLSTSIMAQISALFALYTLYNGFSCNAACDQLLSPRNKLQIFWIFSVFKMNRIWLLFDYGTFKLYFFWSGCLLHSNTWKCKQLTLEDVSRTISTGIVYPTYSYARRFVQWRNISIVQRGASKPCCPRACYIFVAQIYDC